MQPQSLGDVQFKKLVHEFKSVYSVLPDDVIRSYVKQHGNDRMRCESLLAVEAEKLLSPNSGGPAYARADNHHQRYTLKALLDQQIQRHYLLRDEYQMEVHQLRSLKEDEERLEFALGRRHRTILKDVKGEGRASVQENVKVLAESCEELRAKVSSMSRGVGIPEARSPLEAAARSAFVSLVGGTGLSSGSVLGDADAKGWACSVCTLENHAALKRCEVCDMPRFMTGTADAGRVPHPDAECFCHPQQVDSSSNSS